MTILFELNKEGDVTYTLGERPHKWSSKQNPLIIKLIQRNGNLLFLAINNKISKAQFIKYAEWPIKNWADSFNNNEKNIKGAKIYEIEYDWTPAYLLISPDNKQVEYIQTGSGRPVLSWYSGNVRLSL